MTEAEGYLKTKHRWPDLAARAVATTLLANPQETWKGVRQQRLHDWCSAAERDKGSIVAQCDFLDNEFSNSLHALGGELNAAKTPEEATDTARKYLLVGNPARFLTTEEAKATGYADQGNAELERSNVRVVGCSDGNLDTKQLGEFFSS